MNTWQYFIVGLCEHLAWPFVVIWCAYLFRKDICKMLSRITKLPGGAELEPEVRRQQADEMEYEKILAKKNEKKQIDVKEDGKTEESKECVK